MKKLLGVALMLALCASSAFAGVANEKRTVGLYFGTWTPQGFVASGDTTFINGNLAGDGGELDTTGAFSSADMDFFPFIGGADANASVPAMQLNIIANGAVVSSDSGFCTVEWSFDGDAWQSGMSAITQGLVGYSSSSFGFIYGFNRGSTLPPAGAQSTIPWAPLYRFIFRGDGNTACRLSNVKASVTYYVADERTPRAVFQRMSFGTWAAGVFSAEKDTSSIAASASDTTGPLSLANMCIPVPNIVPFGGTAADSAIAVLQLAFVGSIANSTDSLYVTTQASVNGYIWRTNLNKASGTASTIDGRQLVYTGGAVATRLDGSTTVDVAFAALGAVPVAYTQTRFWDSSLLTAQNVRFRLTGGAGALAGGKVWACFFRAPSKR